VLGPAEQSEYTSFFFPLCFRPRAGRALVKFSLLFFILSRAEMDWDEGQVYASDQNLRIEEKHGKEELETNPVKARAKFREFIRCHRDDNVFHYRERLLLNFRKRHYTLEVDLEDLNNFDSTLKDVLQEAPAVFLPQFEEAAREVLRVIGVQQAAGAVAAAAAAAAGADGAAGAAAADAAPAAGANIPSIQITLVSRRHSFTPIRGINAGHVNQLIKVPGIVISQQKVKPKAITIAIRCKKCKSIEYLKCPVAFGGVQLPRQCRRSAQAALQAENGAPGVEDCGLEPYIIQPDLCTYVDTQILKLQECPEDVPTGEMPRHTLLSMERALSGLVPPGTRVAVMAISCIFESRKTKALGNGASIRTPCVVIDAATCCLLLARASRRRERPTLLWFVVVIVGYCCCCCCCCCYCCCVVVVFVVVVVVVVSLALTTPPITINDNRNNTCRYLRVVGLDVQGDGGGRMRRAFKPEDEERFLQMSRQPDIYERICRSISPSISGGYTHDIKKAVACLLFGGSRKILPGE
jgi:DNA replicative helicase MCM subunit Mcm2 (Cdc46/Mcm family)